MSKSMTQPMASASGRGRTLVTLDGRYHVLERIAAGGMGEVFRAQDAVLAREVAIKVLHRSLASDQGFVERFRREARAAATLNHPNIVAVYDWGAVDGIYYMVMEYVQGRSVRELLNAGGKLAPAQAAEILRQTLAALEHAHARGIVHRDLKPENILLTTDGVVKLTDLGLARAFADAKNTRAGAVTGTVQYLAPEQIRGEPADPRSDLYSLGIVAYELLTGELPYTGETPMAIAYQHLSDRVPAPSRSAPEVGAELDGFVLSATDPDREMRPESAAAMRTDLASFSGSLPRARSLGALVQDVPEVERPAATAEAVAATVTETIPRVQRTQRRRWRRWVAVVAAVAILATAAYGAWAYVIPHTHAVPNVVGTGVDQATAELRSLGFSVVQSKGQYDMDVPRGAVLAVDPSVGTKLKEGATVTLLPSLGPPPVAVPNLRGNTVEEATSALQQAGLTLGQVTQIFSDTVPEGRVVRQDPADGKAPTGSGVNLWVSKGHAPVAVPGVLNKSQDRAEKMLRAAGFVPVVQVAYSNDIARGIVIKVDPVEGTPTAYGAPVTITVSQGPEEFPVPNFTGLTKSQAEAKANDVGLHVSFIYLPNTSQTIVLTQTPAAGTTVHAGDSVTLYLT